MGTTLRIDLSLLSEENNNPAARFLMEHGPAILDLFKAVLTPPKTDLGPVCDRAYPMESAYPGPEDVFSSMTRSQRQPVQPSAWEGRVPSGYSTGFADTTEQGKEGSFEEEGASFPAFILSMLSSNPDQASGLLDELRSQGWRIEPPSAESAAAESEDLDPALDEDDAE